MNGYKRTELMQLEGKKRARTTTPKERGIIFIYIDIYKGDMTAYLSPLLSPIVIVTYREVLLFPPIIVPLKNFRMSKTKWAEGVSGIHSAHLSSARL